jgi:hypothetical protein
MQISVLLCGLESGVWSLSRRFFSILRFLTLSPLLSEHCLVDCLYGLARGLVGGVDGEVGETAVERVALLEALLGGGGVCENRAGDVLQHAAVEEGGEGSVEEDGVGGGGLFEEEAVGELFRGSTSKRENGVVAAESGGESSGFEAAEVGLAVALEELGDGGSGAGFEVGVQVEELPVEAGGEETADGGLARSHEACEDEAAEVGGSFDGAGLVVGHDLGLGLGLGFGLDGRHCLSLLMVPKMKEPQPLGCGSGSSKTLKVSRCFQRCMRGLHWPQGCANRRS